jgi:hypothetical protein
VSRVMALSMPWRPMTKPFWDLSALLAKVEVIARLMTAATVLLSVFLRPSGLVLSAVRLAFLALSSSFEPFGSWLASLERVDFCACRGG